MSLSPRVPANLLVAFLHVTPYKAVPHLTGRSDVAGAADHWALQTDTRKPMENHYHHVHADRARIRARIQRLWDAECRIWRREEGKRGSGGVAEGAGAAWYTLNS